MVIIIIVIHTLIIWKRNLNKRQINSKSWENHDNKIQLHVVFIIRTGQLHDTPTPSRWPNIVVKVENQRVAKLAKSASYYYYYYSPDKSFFCLLNNHNDSSTIPIAFIVKFWS